MILSLFYGQVLWSKFWILFGFAEIGIIIFFISVLISALLFWVKNNSYNYKFVPFLICLISAVTVIILPLTCIRNRVNFSIYKNDYENAVLYLKKIESNKTGFVNLPLKYKHLSDGRVSIIVKQNQKAIQFYTFRGIPDGFGGFVKTDKKQNIDSLFNNETNVRDFGNDWYYVSGE